MRADQPSFGGGFGDGDGEHFAGRGVEGGAFPAAAVAIDVEGFGDARGVGGDGAGEFFGGGVGFDVVWGEGEVGVELPGGEDFAEGGGEVGFGDGTGGGELFLQRVVLVFREDGVEDFGEGGGALIFGEGLVGLRFGFEEFEGVERGGGGHQRCGKR